MNENQRERAVAALRKARILYSLMPGAPRVPHDPDGVQLWGEIEGTDHWEFCHSIAKMIIEADSREYRSVAL